MTLHRTIVFFVAVLLSPALAAAQDVVAEVETWQGQTLRIAQPSLEVMYSIVPAPILGRSGAAIGEGAGAPAAAAAPVAVSVGTTTVQKTPVGAGPAPIQGRRPQNFVTFVSSGVEIQVPFERIAAILVERRPVATNMLPSYVEPSMRSVATATLVDGGTIQAAQVNFGNATLRGTIPQGTIELPLDDVKMLKITR